MNLAVIGSGYVGLVTAACFADVGNDVMCLDVDEHKIAMLNRGEVPIYEPGIGELINRNRLAGRLHFTTHYSAALEEAHIIFVAVGTPANGAGQADLQYVLAAARSIGMHIARPVIVVNKSTVPVGTADTMITAISSALDDRGVDIAFDVVSNPEFLKEGVALQDFMKPDRIILGARSASALETMRQLYAPFSRNHEKFIEMDNRSAELTKYAANAMLATRISFMNELANLAMVVGGDIEAIRLGLGTDDRIGSQFLYAGAGYGGSCFPKDLKALIKTGDDHDQPMPILRAVETTNERQKHALFTMLTRYFGGTAKLQGKHIALWGLSFKPDTDDMREAPSLVLIGQLLAAGAMVHAYDPVAQSNARLLLLAKYGKARCDELLSFATSAYGAVEGADVLVLITEWKEFRAPDFHRLAHQLAAKTIFDGRNIYDPRTVTAAGLSYEGIGRPAIRAMAA